uniref:hypothetical protein n=1 Tax=Candidatus Electrothrix sp. TaxID=2170559 RepID=UPI0040569077
MGLLSTQCVAPGWVCTAPLGHYYCGKANLSPPLRPCRRSPGRWQGSLLQVGEGVS